MTDQLSFDLDFRPAYGRDDFFVGTSNLEAITTIDRWPDWGPSPFLIIYGGEGSGKKHISDVWKQKSQAIELNAASFEVTDMAALLAKSPDIILHQLHLLMGDRESEEKLFHLYNHYIGSEGRRVLVTSRRAPGALDILLPDLRSRLLASRTIPIANPDDMLLMQVLGKQLNDKGFQPTEDILVYAMRLMERSWASPRRLADILSRMSLQEHKGLTKKMVRTAIIGLENIEPDSGISTR